MRKNIIEFLIDKNRLDNIVVSKTSYLRIEEAKKGLKVAYRRSYAKSYYHKNTSRCRANWDKYYQENKKTILRKQAKQRKNNVTYKKRQAEYWKTEAGKETRKKWRDKNKDRLNGQRIIKRIELYLVKIFYLYVYTNINW